MDTPSPPPLSAEHEEYSYRTVWSAPPKKPAGRTKFRETRHPVFRGVRRRGQAGRWVCELRVPGRRGSSSRLWLGTFATPELAARAHDAAAIALSGRAACLNFADSAWLLPPLMPPAALATARGIKDAVAEAVEAFRRRRSVSASCAPSSPAAETSHGGEEDRLNSGSLGAASSSAEVVLEIDHAFRFGGMVDAGSYYASLAQGMLVDAPAAAGTGAWWEDVEHSTADIALWSY